MRIDASFELVYPGDDRVPLADLKGRTRAIETLLILAAERERGGHGIVEAEVTRRTAGLRDPNAVRRRLLELEQLGLLRELAGTWTMALDPSEELLVFPRSAMYALLLVQWDLVGDPRRRPRASPQARRDGSVARAELALARGDTDAALSVLADLGPHEAAFVRSLLPQLAKNVQHEFMTRAVGTLGVVLMNRGETTLALHHLRYAQGRAQAWKDGGEWLVRLVATEAAVHRMNAALDPAHTRQHIISCVEAFERGQSLADRSPTLSERSRDELRRWVYAEGTSGLALRAVVELDEGLTISRTAALADTWLGTATDLLGRLPTDPAGASSTHLMKMRFAVLRATSPGDGASIDADDCLLDASDAAEHPLAPAWIQGWVPRYEADLQYLVSRTDDRSKLRDRLAVAWRRNGGFGFQQLLILARLAVWKVQPTELGLPDGEMLRLETTIGRWHRRLRGRPIAHCDTCTNTSDYLRRIRCTLQLPTTPRADPLGLGVWR